MNLRKRTRRTSRLSAQCLHRLFALAVLVVLVGVVVAVSLAFRSPGSSRFVLEPLTPSSSGVTVSSGFRGDPKTGATLTVRATGLSTNTTSSPAVSAPSAILINLESGTVLFEKNADTRRAMASTTKMMTAILVLERLKLNTKVTASALAEATNESQMDLRQGEVDTVKELLEGLLVDSANDAAVALAEACSGSVEASPR